MKSCFQCSKDTKMGANHNMLRDTLISPSVVSNVPKILKWEQITTCLFLYVLTGCCFQCSKDTKMGANHNLNLDSFLVDEVVSNVPKILKWEQITTCGLYDEYVYRCFQCSKDTKMGANHNSAVCNESHRGVVSNVPKILKWEQITT